MKASWVWGFVAIAACKGGGGSIATGGQVTSLPEGQDVASLSPSDQQTLCEDVRRYFEEKITPESTKPFGCSFAGFAAGSSASRLQQDPRAACQKAYDECLAQPVREGQNVTVTELGKDCNVSQCRGVNVGDYAACAREVVDAIGSYSFSCASAGTAAAAPTPSFTGSASCQKVQTSCARE